MTLKEHKKHSAIARPAMGNFSRNEWAILGGHCTKIKLLADNVIAQLSPGFKIAYADTTHNDDATPLPGRLESGAALEFTDQLTYSQLNYNGQLTPFAQRQLFAGVDLVLVNGNHQQAKSQAVIIDNNKMASLQKRLAQLTNVELFLLADNADDIFDFVKDAVPQWQSIPVLKLDDTAAITAFFAEKMQLAKPKLKGLVLAGGKSERMGHDKGAVLWHGKEQRYYMADMLKSYCTDVYISCRDAKQQAQIVTGYNALPDTFTGLGPYSGILSAFREDPDAAWLVVACDLPLVNEAVLSNLVASRNTSKVATAFKSLNDDFPEPLITIYEPKAYPQLLQFLAQGYSCPRKVLINTDINLLPPPADNALTNVNTPEELEHVKQLLQQKTVPSNAS